MLFAFKEKIFEMAKTDKRVVLILSDQDIGLNNMKEALPCQYFMEGISEANAVGMAYGLAADGFIPFIVNHASFMARRSYEQIAMDACLQERPVRLIGMGGGVATAHLGPTHTVIEDIAIMRAIPNMTVIAPCDAEEMKRLMPLTVKWPNPIYIRLARYGKPIVSKEEDGFEIGKAILLHQAENSEKAVLLVSTGSMTNRAVDVAKELELGGLSCSVLHVHTIKPLDVEAITKYSKKAKLVVTLEEHSLVGGLGSACLEVMMDNLSPEELPRVYRVGLPDKFIHCYGTQESLMIKFGLDVPQIVAKIRNLL